MSTDRDAYDLPETPERRLVLEMVLDKKIHTWAGDAIHNDTNKPLDPPLNRAFRELARAGLIIGEIFTGNKLLFVPLCDDTFTWD